MSVGHQQSQDHEFLPGHTAVGAVGTAAQQVVVVAAAAGLLHLPKQQTG